MIYDFKSVCVRTASPHIEVSKFCALGVQEQTRTGGQIQFLCQRLRMVAHTPASDIFQCVRV